MIITMQDREELKAIVTEALAAALGEPVLETKLEPAMPPETISIDDLVDKVRGYRTKAKNLSRTLDKFRDHPFESKNARKAIEKARDDVEEAREELVAFAKRIGDGSIIVDWD